jgi:hypothetical protein
MVCGVGGMRFVDGILDCSASENDAVGALD